jgi:hypothetical protein
MGRRRRRRASLRERGVMKRWVSQRRAIPVSR